jgi:hypothetical protein
MAGSYEHIRRATKPTDNTAESYGGLDTSLVENMGDAIEAMVHMWWMIQILANGNKALIKKVSHQAQGYETGHLPIPPGPWNDAPTDDDDDEATSRVVELDAAALARLRFAHAKGEGEKPAPLPTYWTPTMYLRFVKRHTTIGSPPTASMRFILQQGYIHNATGERMWVDVPTVEE